MPTHPPELLLLAMYLAESHFGLAYAILVHWISMKGYMQGSVAWQVVIGVAVTLFIQWLFLPNNPSVFVTFGSFACTGFWMATTYLFRHEKIMLRKRSHKARAWPPRASAMRDEVIMALKDKIRDIEEKAESSQVTAGFLLKLSNGLQDVINLLKSV